MEKEYKTLTGTTILFAGANIVSKVLKILLVPLYTVFLTTSECGTGETVIITVNLLYPVFLLGVNEAALRFTMKDESKAEAVFSNCIAIVAEASLAGSLMIAALWCLPLFRPYLPVMYIMTVASAVEALMMAETKGLGRNTLYAVSEIISTAALICLNIILVALLRTGIIGYLWSMAGASAARIILLSFFPGKTISADMKSVDRTMKAAILKFSLPFMPASILWWIMDSSGRYMVMWFLGSSAAGIYAVSFRLSALVTSISVIFHHAWQLSAIRQYSLGKYETFYKSAMRSYNVLFFTGVSVLIAFVRPIMGLLDDSFEEAWRYAPVLLIAAVFFALSGLVCANYTVCEKTGGVLLASFIGAAVSAGSGLILTPLLGMQGTAASALLAFYIMWLIMTVHTGRLMGFRHEYLTVHLNLVIVIAETIAVLQRSHPFLIALCMAALLLVNIKPLISMLFGPRNIK